MKRYLIATIAVLVSLSLTAFESNCRLTTVTTVFVGNAFVQTEVSDPSNWQVISPVACVGTTKACEIELDDIYTDNSLTPNTILSTVAISTAGNSFTGFRPIDASINGVTIPITIHNKN